MPFSATTTGSFSAGAPSDLTFTGTTFSGNTHDDLVCFLLGSCGVSGNIALGQFHLGNPGFLKPADVYDGKGFTLTVDFMTPDNVQSDPHHYTASLSGTIHWYDLANPMTIDFGGPQHITFGPGANGIGSFDFKVENPFILLNDNPKLYGEIFNAQIDATPSAVPEPGSVVLLLTAAAGAFGIARRKRA